MVCVCSLWHAQTINFHERVQTQWKSTVQGSFQISLTFAPTNWAQNVESPNATFPGCADSAKYKLSMRSFELNTLCHTLVMQR